MPILSVLDESLLHRDLANLKSHLKSLSAQARAYKWQLIAINNVLEGIVRKKRKYVRKVQKQGNSNIPQNVKNEVCPKCSGTGIINVDKAGIFARYCDCEAGQKKLAEKKRIFDK